jgi:hypothetical protein
LHEIGRAFGKGHASIHFLLSHHDGIAPAARRRSLLALTLAEREDISRGIACGSSIREIAKRLKRAASTVSREVSRHGGRPQYRANEASKQTFNCSSGGHCKTRFTPKGKCVSLRVSRITCLTPSGLRRVTESIPSPPALETAAARAGHAPLPMGAWTMGSSMFSRRQRPV